MTAQLSREVLRKVVDAADAVISALAGENEDVHKDDSTKMCRLWDELNDKYAPPEIVRGIARMLLAGLDREPVAWIVHARQGDMLTSDGDFVANAEGISSISSTPLYAATPTPVALPDREQVRVDHAKWSQDTFGNVGPIGPLKHLSKEALEAAAKPGDLSEWADMQFLLWDAQRRAGITDEQIMQAMIDKLEVNKARQWPEPKDGEPRMHIKAAPEREV